MAHLVDAKRVRSGIIKATLDVRYMINKRAHFSWVIGVLYGVQSKGQRWLISSTGFGKEDQDVGDPNRVGKRTKLVPDL